MNSTDNPEADHPVSMRGANRADAMIVAFRETVMFGWGMRKW
jgi:hypothetical protein